MTTPATPEDAAERPRLQDARGELEVAARRYADLYDFAPVGYFTLASDGVIRELNFAGAKLLGAERARLVGRSFGGFVLEAYAPLCVEKGLSIAGTAPALGIPCDRNRVGQVLGNLVANAIKFTPNGGAIAIEAVSLESEVRFSVTDTGPGIPEEARAHVFERYWRGEERDYTKGVGLGLFISKDIIASHGGKIWVESTVGRGSTFYFTLPLAPSARSSSRPPGDHV